MDFLRCITVLIMLHFTTADLDNVYDNDLFDNSHQESDDDYAYDFNAILGRVESLHFNTMSPKESKSKFSEIIDIIDVDQDGSVSLTELKKWILDVLNQITAEDVDKQWKEFNPENMQEISFDQYVSKVFGERRSEERLKLIKMERRRWMTADLNNDTLLNKTELFRFLHPEVYDDMKPVIAQETLEGMDTNNDTVIDINEYLNDMFPQGKAAKEEWIRNERQNFGIDRDINKDGVMDRDEIQRWILPESYNRVDAEAQHIMELVDLDRNQILSKTEMLDQYKVFVGNYRKHDYTSREDL